MIHIAVSGAHGRMGQLIVKAVEADKNMKLAGKIIRTDPISTKEVFSPKKVPLDVLIDFAPPEAVLEHLAFALQHNTRMVIGTTGFTEDQKNQIKIAAKKIPIVCAPNMSIAVNVAYKLLDIAANLLTDKADIAITDLHHKNKKDAPSGTALHMAEIMERSFLKRGNKNSNVAMASLRLGNATGEHKVLFSLDGETLEITHRALDPSAYVRGAIEAAKWLMQQKPDLYDMQDVLDLKS